MTTNMAAPPAAGLCDDDPDHQLDRLTERAHEEWRQTRDAHPDVVPASSAPVLYFGDLPATAAPGCGWSP